MKFLLVIGGATAVGKTKMAIALAQHFGTEIISADSRQFYRQMSIGTAKPSAEELAAAKHHFIDSHDITEPFSVGDFEHATLAVLENIFSKNDYAIMVGGSGLFIKAVCDGLDTFPEISETTRQLVAKNELEQGLSYLQNEVERLDPEHFKQMDSQNAARLRRALEVCIESGQPYTSFLQKEKKPRDFTPIYIQLDLPRPQLYARIEARVDAMISAGLEAEAMTLHEFRHFPVMRTVGYEEWFDFETGIYATRKEVIEKIKQHTRNYAKRQATWFRKYGDWTVFSPDDVAGVVDFILKAALPLKR